MSQKRDRIGVGTMALLVMGTICAILFVHSARVSKSAAASQPDHPAATPVAAAKPTASEPAAPESSQLVSLTPDQVLATVNGRVIRLADIIPLADTNGAPVALDKVTLNYFLKRAVDRDLIFQAAQQQGIALDESQHQQLAALQAMRNQPEPGGIARLNDTPASNQLEMEDSQAFMLQTTLMSAQGDSPNVTEDQVAAYYTGHESEFGGMSLDAIQQNQEMWQQAEVAIRNEIAVSVRATYNNQVTAYMGNLESAAKITMSPVASL
ncbi:MAG TPA: hypothetical protein VGJ73_18980 [Verrucomicrobiae bacterium]